MRQCWPSAEPIEENYRGMRTQDLLKYVALFGAFLIFGIGLYTFVYAEGAAYLTNDPKACMNCHVMTDHFNAWTKSSHHAVAVCNDCHTPKGLVNKYFTKALNGWNHSVAFTSGRFHDPIQITQRNARITESSCRKCHADVVHAIDVTSKSEPFSCVRCHSTVGHME